MEREKNVSTNVAVSDEFARVLNESLKEYTTLKTVTEKMLFNLFSLYITQLDSFILFHNLVYILYLTLLFRTIHFIVYVNVSTHHHSISFVFLVSSSFAFVQGWPIFHTEVHKIATKCDDDYLLHCIPKHVWPNGITATIHTVVFLFVIATNL